MLKRILKNIFAVIVGWILGSFLNMGLVELGNLVFPIKGINMNSMEELAIVIPTLNATYFIFPFLAHALGTLVGAIVAAFIAVSHKLWFALSIGGLFFIGGAMMVSMLPNSPMLFNVTDLVLAYIPMGWLGYKVAVIFTKSNN